METAIGADDLRVKKEVTVKALIVDGSPDAINRQIIYFSDWRKLGSCGLVSKDQKELEMSHRSREPDAQSRAPRSQSFSSLESGSGSLTLGVVQRSVLSGFIEMMGTRISPLAAGEAIVE